MFAVSIPYFEKKIHKYFFQWKLRILNQELSNSSLKDIVNRVRLSQLLWQKLPMPADGCHRHCDNDYLSRSTAVTDAVTCRNHYFLRVSCY